MAVDKAIEYKMQGSKKPAKNYLGKQKTVSKVPVKWQSGPDTPPTELAYITEAEKNLILKADLHGSLKDGPNTGPDGIMSLDSQGDYTRDRSPGAYGGGSRQDRDRNEQHMREILTGQKNIGQTTKTGPRTRQYSNLPEYMKVKQKDGTYKDKYIGSAYKSYGTPSFFGNLFSRGAPGYRGIKGLSAFGTPTFEATQGPDGMGYYTDDTDFGEIRDALPTFGLLGLLSNLSKKFRKPKDMSEFNELGLLTDRVNPTFQNDLGNELMLSTQKTPERFLPNAGPKPAGDAVSYVPFANYGKKTPERFLPNAGPQKDVVSYVPFSNYGKADAATTGTTVDGVPLEEFVKNAAIAPTPVEQYRNKAYTGIQENVGKPISNFLNNLMNADQIAALEDQFGSKYGITNTAGGKASDARHMAAMNELSNSLSPMNNKFGNFIGDTLAFGAGAINEIPALFRGLDSKNLGEIKEDIIANYKGSFGTPNQTTAEQIYEDVFAEDTPVQTASLFADGGLASMFTRRG